MNMYIIFIYKCKIVKTLHSNIFVGVRNRLISVQYKREYGEMLMGNFYSILKRSIYTIKYQYHLSINTI